LAKNLVIPENQPTKFHVL